MTTTNDDEGALERSVLANLAKERLLQRILDGTYPPNSRIVETKVARELNTSQAPIREALRGLEALGLVEITPFRGARERRPTRHQSSSRRTSSVLTSRPSESPGDPASDGRGPRRASRLCD